MLFFICINSHNDINGKNARNLGFSNKYAYGTLLYILILTYLVYL